MRAVSPGRRSERGVVVVLVALLLTALLGFLGFVLNAGHATSVKGELQNAADSAALAAARELNGRADGIAAARSVAVSYSQQHDTDTTQQVSITDGDIAFCNWDPSTHTIRWALDYGVTPTTAPFPPIPALTQLQAVNAVRVRNGRETSRGNALPVWLSSFLGAVTSMDTRSTATAIGGGPISPPPATPCLPLAYVDCAFSVGCGGTIVFRDDNDDTAGFTLLGDSNVSAQGVTQFLQSGVCPTNIPPAISMSNGNITKNQVWDLLANLVGSTYAIPVVHSDDCKIDRSQLYPIDSYAEITITGVYRNGATLGLPADCNGVTGCITATVTCNNDLNGASPGGLPLGLNTLRTQLVQ